MEIYSTTNSLWAYFPETRVYHRWVKGSHYAGIWNEGIEIDCYTFAWEKNRASMLDFTTALVSYLSEE